MSVLKRKKIKRNNDTNFYSQSSGGYELKARVISKLSKRIGEKFKVYSVNIMNDCKEALNYAK